MNNIDMTEAVEAVAKAAYCADMEPEFHDHMWGTADLATTEAYYREARAALAAALPYVEKQVRAQVAAEIDAEYERRYREYDIYDSHTEGILDALSIAEQIARTPKETS